MKTISIDFTGEKIRCAMEICEEKNGLQFPEGKEIELFSTASLLYRFSNLKNNE